MRKRSSALLLLASCIALACPALAMSDTIRIGVYSQKESPSRASIGARIAITRERLGVAPEEAAQRTRSAEPVDRTSVPLPESLGVAAPQTVVYPTLAADSTLLRNPQPLGPNTFWYPDGARNACIFVPSTSPLCYVLAQPAGPAARLPALNPAAIAASLADRLALSPGQVQASPSAPARGLTGTESWFWLKPAPGEEELALSLAGESVTVMAEPTIEWSFGDGATLAGGLGRAYTSGPAPADSIRHRYETRCLPGDRGRNPYVRSSCDANGYRVEALVHWRVSYRASGRIAAGGALPTRTTASAIDYPVTEARAFLVPGPTP